MTKKEFAELLTELLKLAASYSTEFHAAAVNAFTPIAEKYGVDFPGTALSSYDFEDCVADEFNNRQRVYNALTQVLKSKQIKPCPPFPYAATAGLACVEYSATPYNYDNEFREDF